MKKTLFLLLSAAALALVLCACGSTEDAMAPVEMEIHDSIADVAPTEDGMATLLMDGVITNTSKLHSAEADQLPQLTMDGEAVEAEYEYFDGEDHDKLGPGEWVYYHISHDFDPTVDHEWKFQSADDTVVSGLDDYDCIKEALRNFEGKPPVTMEDIKQMEKEQKERYQEFLKEEAAQNQ